MKTILITILLLFQNHSSCLEMDIILIGDLSGSVRGHQNYVAAAMKSFTDRFDFSEAGLKLGIITFNDQSDVRLPLTTSKQRIVETIESVGRTTPNGLTYMEFALEDAFNQLYAGRRVQKLIVIISDGEPTNAEAAANTARLLRSSGILICGVYVKSGASSGSGFLKSICEDGCFTETSYSGIATVLKQMDICL